MGACGLLPVRGPQLSTRKSLGGDLSLFQAGAKKCNHMMTFDNFLVLKAHPDLEDPRDGVSLGGTLPQSAWCQGPQTWGRRDKLVRQKAPAFPEARLI